MSFFLDSSGRNAPDNDMIHFTGDSSFHSYALTFDDNEDMPEEAVRDYIRSQKPQLFNKLHGLPFASTDIPMSFHGQRSLRRLQQFESSRPIAQIRFRVPTTNDEPLYYDYEPPTANALGEPFARTSSTAFGLRTMIEHKLANGLIPYQREGPMKNCDLEYNSNFCSEHPISPSQWFLSLEYDFSSAVHNSTTNVDTEHYCSSFWDKTFTADVPQTTESQNQLLLDGIDRQTLLRGADDLYPNVHSYKHDPIPATDRHARVDQAFNYPSNSPQNHRIRAHRQKEIEETLAEVRKYEKAVQASQKPHDDQEISLVLRRPAYLEPAKDRYKKQGLTQYDCRKQAKEDKRHVLARCLESSEAISPTTKTPPRDRICHCRELDDGTSEKLKCSAAYCPVGWFHLKCTGLPRLPTIYECFLCQYCSDGVEAYIKESAEYDESGLVSQPVTPTSARFLDVAAVQVQEECYEDLSDDGVEGYAEQSIYDDEESHHKTLHERVNKWVAVNGSAPGKHEKGDVRPLSPFTSRSNSSSSSEDNSNPASRRNSSLPNDDKENYHFHYSEARPPPTITDSSHGRVSSSILLPCIDDLPNELPEEIDNDPFCPVTPPLAPIRVSKPWGTPVNLQKLVHEPTSPSPVKRKLSPVDEDSPKRQKNSDEDVGVEIPDSEDEGEEVIVVLDRRYE